MKRGILQALLGCAFLACTLRVGLARTEPDGPFADFVEPGFPFIASILEAGKLGPAFPARNIAVRCLVLMLGNDTYACFDTGLLRVAAAWHGGFMTLGTMAQASYHEAGNKETGLPTILGQPISATGIYPGWMGGAPEFSDPRPPGQYLAAVGRGPVSTDFGRWNGIYVVGGEAVLSYTVRGTDVREQLSSVAVDDQIGVARTFQAAPAAEPLVLVVAEVIGASAHRVEGNTAVVVQGADTVTAVGIVGAPAGARLQVHSNRYITLHLPAGAPASLFRVVTWRGPASERSVLGRMLRRPLEMAIASRGGPPHWPETVHTRGRVSPDTSEYVSDLLTLPVPNPWRRNVRIASVDFFRDGRAALVTFDGDVWIVSGIDRGLQNLWWKRFASGLYEPLTLQVVDDTIYVFDRQGIVRLHDLNGDGEADYYENFSNLNVQSGESREFPLGMAARRGGGFYLAIGGALNGGYPMTPKVTEGFRAGSPHSGSILEVSADGRSIRTYATGFREPSLGVHPRTGLVTASDQQGHFVPSTPVYIVPDGGYHGVPATAHRELLPEETPPLVWIPHAVDRSGAGQLWITDERMGLGTNALVHLSYARPGALRVLVDSTAHGVQGAIVPVPADHTAPILQGEVRPADGQLYLAGFRIYGSTAPEVSGFSRLRYTGMGRTLPTAVEAGAQGIVIHFPTPLDSATASDPARYRIERWDYRRSEKYGSPHLLSDGSPGQERVPVGAAYLSRDRMAVLLVIAGVRKVMQMSVGYDLRTPDARHVKNSVYLTIRHVQPLDLAAVGFHGVDWEADAARAELAASELARAASAASAEEGAALYRRVGCAGCHSVDGSLEGRAGPTFGGLYGWTRVFADGSSQRAYEDYLRNSILQPGSQIVQGYEEGMPSYEGVLTASEVESLVLYIKSLGTDRR